MSDSAPKPKYIVAVNFTRKSEAALEYALTTAPSQGAVIYMFHVFESASGSFSRLDKLNVETMERMRHVMVNALQRLNDKGIHPHVEDVERRLANGKVASELRRIAEGVQPDLLIMGAPGSNAFRKLFSDPPCTVVLVKDKEES